MKVGKITFAGNKAIKSRELQTAMKNLKPIGIPHSIFLENLFSRTYDSTKLNEDAERVRYYYQTKGYFKALVADPKTQDPRYALRRGIGRSPKSQARRLTSPCRWKKAIGTA